MAGTRDEDLSYTCDSCGEGTEHPVSVNFPLKGGVHSPLDFCPECAKGEMQSMADRLGHEHGSAKVLEVKSRQAKRGPRGVGEARRGGAGGSESGEDE